MVRALVILAAILASGWDVASAEESAEPVDPGVVVLEPGENLVGWLGAPLPVERLTTQFPPIETVRAWEPLSGKFYEPASLLPGQSYVFTVSGTESLQWRRPMTPVKSRVMLERGRNLVAWMGPDGWTIRQVARGIGRALVRAEWDHHEYLPVDAAVADPTLTVQRGDALWIEVRRRVNWLQPAGVMPPIVFAGEAPEPLQTAVRRDSVDVMNHFADEFGVQPDGSILTVYVATDPESLTEALERDGRETSGIYDSWYTSGGWADPSGYIVLKLEQWQPDEQGVYGEYTLGRGVLAHEYYHAIQQQMSSTDAAQWLVEGGADWAEAGVRRRDAASSLVEELADNRQSMLSGDAPPLDHAERSVDLWHYTLGALASDRLAQRSGADALLEFWRQLLPQPLGPLGRWQSRPPWQSVFRSVFGLSVDFFYAEFASWRASLAPASIRGRVVGPDGAGLPYVRITGLSPRLADDQYDWFEAYTDQSGAFELAATGGGVQLGVDLGGCELYYSASGLVPRRDDAELLSLAGADSRGLVLSLKRDHCVWQLAGVLVDHAGEPLGDTRVHAHGEGISVSAQTERGGSFAITVPVNGSYRLNVLVNSCWVYYRQGEAPGSWQEASQLQVEDHDIAGLRFQLTEGLCSTKIAGRLLDADGAGIPHAWVHASSEDGWSASARAESDGTFVIFVPGPGQYRINTSIDGCHIFYRRGAATGFHQQATQIRVSDSDVTDVSLQLAAGMCERKIRGTLLNADGTPRSGVLVYAHGLHGSSGIATSDVDGSFAIAVPERGAYRLSTYVSGCWIYHSSRGPTDWTGARQIRVSGTHVSGIEFRLPENPPAFCG
ncbi:MAG: carboxypeptidase regulatory-like domain-containing protein [Dehalococcoidia bacterium]|nr:carboxypeptidase regulatory-like domain-containing protein [Dehalococcoidia bacterium]MYI86210.1 carboxypeptidase regulatory-like domain-containing protein [Dehalococcoidia bacterium]